MAISTELEHLKHNCHFQLGREKNCPKKEDTNSTRVYIAGMSISIELDHLKTNCWNYIWNVWSAIWETQLLIIIRIALTHHKAISMEIHFWSVSFSWGTKSKGTKASVDSSALMGAVYFSFHCNYIIIINALVSVVDMYHQNHLHHHDHVWQSSGSASERDMV